MGTSRYNEQGSKRRLGDGERRASQAYSDWRRTVGGNCYVQDVDWLEYRQVNGSLRFVAVIETTFYEDKPHWRHKLPVYCAEALARFREDGQGVVVPALALALKVEAYFVIGRYDLEVFHICRLSDDAWWRDRTRAKYRRWLECLGPFHQDGRSIDSPRHA